MKYDLKEFKTPRGVKHSAAAIALMLLAEEQGMHQKIVRLYDAKNDSVEYKLVFKIKPDKQTKKRYGTKG